MRGNIDTRIGRVGADLDAVILARAGIERTNRMHLVAESLNISLFMPAPAQGALAIECRKADSALVEFLRGLDDVDSHARALAERAVLNELEAGCTAPVAAYSEVTADGELALRAGVFAVDGSRKIIESQTGPLAEADALGRSVAARLRELGAIEIMGDSLRESQE